MQQNEFNWTNPDGLKIYAKEWAITQPKGVICLVHGLGEHVNRYNHVAKFFNENGYAMIGSDHSGHGQSGEKRGHAKSYSVYMDEIAQLLVEAEERYPNVPTFLYGHSMGGNLALRYTIERHPNIHGLVVTGPFIQLAFEPPKATLFVGKLLRRVMPGFTQANDLNPNDVSSDPAVVQAYIDDPLVHNKITFETAISLLEVGGELDKYKGKMPVPTLAMHGSDDKITSHPATKAFAERVVGVDFKGWSGMYHEIHNEPEKQKVFKYTLDWLNSHL